MPSTSPGRGARSARHALHARRARILSSALVALVAPALTSTGARADALPDDYEPPVCAPVACPEGSVGGGGGHGSCPSQCVPIRYECAADGTCAAGARCVPTRFCIDMRPTGRVVQDVVLGVCAEGGACAEGTCREVARCVTIPPGTGGPSLPGPREGSGSGSAGAPTATTPAPASPSDGLCSVAHRRTLPFARFAVAISVVALLRARRSRRRSRA